MGELGHLFSNGVSGYHFAAQVRGAQQSNVLAEEPMQKGWLWENPTEMGVGYRAFIGHMWPMQLTFYKTPVLHG